MANEVINRMQEADYIDVGVSGTPNFVLAAVGFVTLDETLSAQTTSKQYINAKSQSSSVTSYQYSAPFTTDLIQDQEAVSYINDIAEKEKLGGDAETDYVKVKLWSPVSTDAANTEFDARKRRVSVQVENRNNNSGELQLSGNLVGKSDWVYGKFDTSTNTFTPEDDTAPATP